MVSFFVVAAFLLPSFGAANPSALGFGSQVSNSDATTVPLEVFQVKAPLRTSYDGAVCEQVVVQYNFAASYGTPFVGMK